MNERVRRYVAESLGTFALVFAGTGAVVADALSGGAVTQVGISIVFGAIVMMMVVAFGPISGAHINPAVTIALWAAREFEGREVVPYIISQCVGAIVASGLLLWMYPTTPTLGQTLPIGAAAPAFVMEVFLTTLLMLVILACAVGSRCARSSEGRSLAHR
jgi:aquaporin NIP